MTAKTKPTPTARLEELSANERSILAFLLKERRHDVAELAKALDWPIEWVRSACSWLQAKGFVDVEEHVTEHVALSDEGRAYAKAGLPERRLFEHVWAHGGRVALDAAGAGAGLSPAEMGIALSWWQRKGLGTMDKDGDARLLVTRGDASSKTPDERALGRLAAADSLEAQAMDPEGLKLLSQRKGLLQRKEAKTQSVVLRPEIRIDPAALEAVEDLVEEITPELLKSGSWRERRVRPFDVTAPSPRATPGKPHPLQQIIQEVRQIFLEMGFEEIEYDYVQSTFWNMDALFIPQDHPAREMQDTYYVSHPESVPVPEDVVDVVAEVHESGGKTGSRGWGGTYSRKEARRPLLRTHTTVGTIRHLAANPARPCRVFSVDRVFRNETMDATHLPEFHQVEGIATEPGANFRQLIGILRDFYRRLGFEKVRVRPGYFPYTEPSMEVEVFYNGRWMELGGSGIFRPEVTEPLGVKTPVLAWGLGLERLAMLRLARTDIRDLYISDLEWLRRQPLV